LKTKKLLQDILSGVKVGETRVEKMFINMQTVALPPAKWIHVRGADLTRPNHQLKVQELH